VSPTPHQPTGAPSAIASPPASEASRPVRWEELIAVFCLAMLVLLTLANVVVRYLTDESFAATEEISIALMVVMVLAGASAAAVRDQHIRIEFFYETGSPARRRLLALVSAAMTCVFFLVLCVLSGRVVWDEYSYQETSMALGVPRWWYTVWVPLLSVAIAVRAAQVFMRVRRGEMLPGGSHAAAAGAIDEDHAL
jgi:TRAP-type C4-dicarboxylate transport system permease small subunit